MPDSFLMMYCWIARKAGDDASSPALPKEESDVESSFRSYCSMKVVVNGRSKSVCKSSVKVDGPTMAGISGRISEETVRGCQASSLMIAGKYFGKTAVCSNILDVFVRKKSSVLIARSWRRYRTDT
mmetsp:Transcript_46386/g.99358  ORF Transcript_46386/g.99358 Transcript_46386/m.99358 type:complete len:126 (-) Transcript_46386:166-543(-)